MKAIDIKAALRRSYCQPEWAIFFEVSDRTGAANRRWANAVAMNMWPSRGLELRGFEIKVTRSDFFNEMRDPAKAEAVAQYCDTFYLATPKGLTKGLDIPHAWGLIEVSEAGRPVIRKQAVVNQSPADLTKTFMAGLIRAAGKITEAELKARLAQDLAAIRKDEADITDKLIEREKRLMQSSQGKHEELHTKLTEIMGINATNLLCNTGFLNAVALVHGLGLHNEWQGLAKLRKDMKTAAATAEGLARMMDKYIEKLTSHD